MFETNHRWAAGQQLGADVSGCNVASVSFTNDLVVLVPSQITVEQLVAAYLQWCTLLAVTVTRCSSCLKLGHCYFVSLGVSFILETPVFRFVGIELSLADREGKATNVSAQWHVSSGAAMSPLVRVAKTPVFTKPPLELNA